MIYNEFDKTPGPPEPEIPAVVMCPTFFGCIWLLIAGGVFAVLVITCLVWAFSAAVVR